MPPSLICPLSRSWIATFFSASGINYSQIKSKRGFSLKHVGGTPKTQMFSTTLGRLIYFLFGIKFRFSVFLLFLDNDWIYKCPALSGNMVKPYKRKPRWGKSLSPVYGYGCVDVKMWKKLTWHRSLKSNILLQSAVQRREYFVLRHCQTKEQTNLTYSCERSLHLSMK